jgi:hypothetical protein
MVFTENELFQLKKMIETNNTDDHTDHIRSVKHSNEIRKALHTFLKLKVEHNELWKNDKSKFEEIVLKEDSFLFHNYYQIHMTLLKDQFDVSIMLKLLAVLEKIESGELDQHEGSFVVGKLLKEIYIDGTIKNLEKLDELSEQNKPVLNNGTSISWKEFKKSKL